MDTNKNANNKNTHETSQKKQDEPVTVVEKKVE